MLGYYCDPTATAEAIDEMGRLHTGDLGYLDQDGNLHISGRKKDIIIRNGNNISARKIEEALHTLAGISQAAVVGIYHEKWGEIPCALVITEPGFLPSPEEIRNRLTSILTKLELPEKILFRDQMPLTSSGKPDKQRIKSLFTKSL